MPPGGLGYLLSPGQEASDAQLALASLLILSLPGDLLYRAIHAAERRLLGWHASTDHDNLPSSSPRIWTLQIAVVEPLDCPLFPHVSRIIRQRYQTVSFLR